MKSHRGRGASKHRILLLKHIDFAVDVFRAVDDRAEAVDYGLMANGACADCKRIMSRGWQAVTGTACGRARLGPLRRGRVPADHLRSIDEIVLRLRFAQTPIPVAIRVAAGVRVEVINAVRFAIAAFRNQAAQRPAEHGLGAAIILANVRDRKEIARHGVALLANALRRQIFEIRKMLLMRAHRGRSRGGLAVQTFGRRGVDQLERVAAAVAMTEIATLRAFGLRVAGQTRFALFRNRIILPVTNLARAQIVMIALQVRAVRICAIHPTRSRMRITRVARTA